MKTMLLDQLAWDLVLDANGNWALAGDPYSLAQDAASSMRTFRGEAYYDQSLGVPYFELILGHQPPTQVIKSALETEALRVPDVVSATAFLRRLDGRQLVGQIQVRDAAGNVAAVG